MSLNVAINKILVPVDGSEPSERAAKYAVYLAKKLKAHIIAVHVMHVPAYFLTTTPIEGMPTPAPIPVQVTVSGEEKKVVEGYLNKVKEIAKNADVALEAKILENQQPIVRVITEFAENEGCSLIVMGTKGRTGMKRFLLGSVASGVVTYAHCPVLVVR